MQSENVFSYIYRAPENLEVRNIRNIYLPPEETGSLNKSKKEVFQMRNHDQEFLVQKIRTQYTEVKHTELDALKALDAKVKKPANFFAYTYGSASAIIMGAGMSLVMTDLGSILGLENSMAPGIVIGVVGMALALTTYPIYKKILAGRKKKYAAQILTLSEKLMGA